MIVTKVTKIYAGNIKLEKKLNESGVSLFQDEYCIASIDDNSSFSVFSKSDDLAKRILHRDLALNSIVYEYVDELFSVIVTVKDDEPTSANFYFDGTQIYAGILVQKDVRDICSEVERLLPIFKTNLGSRKVG